MINEEWKELIDHRNSKLWDELCNSQQEIKIEKSPEPNYAVFSQGSTSIIYVEEGNLNPASFAHELLHIKNSANGIYLNGALIRLRNGSSLIQKMFPQKLMEHIGNCLEHIKMLPEFLEMGYLDEEFISDYHQEKLPDDEIKDINKEFKKTKSYTTTYNALAIEYFVAKYFAAKACNNNAFDHEKQLEKLKSVDESLFNILNDFMEKWNNYDFSHEGDFLNYDGYNIILFNLIEALETWASNKNIA